MKRRKQDEIKKKGRKKRSSGSRITVLICIGILFTAAVVILFFYAKGKDIFVASRKDTGYHELKNGEIPDNIDTQVKSSEDYVEPGAGTLNVDKIQGFKAKEPGDQGENGKPGLSDTDLTIESVGAYTGQYIEDGSDESISNVASLVITNHSDRMLQIAEISFRVTDTEIAQFKVTDLPAGTSALVLEANKRQFSDEDNYSYGEVASGYMEEPTLEEDSFDLVTEKGKITLKNKTDQDFEKVYVYYKYVQIGGAYLGGITYRTPFENVKAGDESEAVAAHFNPDSSKIMAVQIINQQ